VTFSKIPQLTNSSFRRWLNRKTKLNWWLCGSRGEGMGMATISIFFKCSWNTSLRVQPWVRMVRLSMRGMGLSRTGDGCHEGNAPSVAYFCFCFCGCLEAFFFVHGCVCGCVSMRECATLCCLPFFYFIFYRKINFAPFMNITSSWECNAVTSFIFLNDFLRIVCLFFVIDMAKLMEWIFYQFC